MDHTLPPFGIRHLKAEVPLSLIRITEQEYQSTVQDSPSATLTYVDEDDGEVVTIGSGLELRQRLEEPPLVTAHSVYSINDNREDQLVHLFDIKRTSSVRKLWAAHEYTYDKNQIQYEPALRGNNDHDSVSSIDLDAEFLNNDDKSKDSNSKAGQVSEASPTTYERHMTGAVSEIVPEMVDNLAALLELTSESLRKAASKSRHSNTSPIEDILTGFGGVVTEIGNFGLSLLDSLIDPTEDAINAASQNREVTQPSEQRGIESSEKVETTDEDSTMDLDGIISSLSSMRHTLQSVPSACEEPLQSDERCQFCASTNLVCFNDARHEIKACRNCTRRNQICSWEAASVESSQSIPRVSDPPATIRISPKKDDSILDQDTEDADFSRRYPPLTSLRRANTIAEIRTHFNTAKPDNSGSHALNRHNTWTKRFPQRPAPYVLDAETQRRRGFAQDCFPTQKYTPGPGTKDAKLPPLRKPHGISNVQVSEINPQIADTPQRKSQPTAIVREQYHAEGRFEQKQASLPGSWPEFGEEQGSSNILSGESSGAFFNRMMRDNPTRRQNNLSDTNERLTRHRSFHRSRPSNNPFSDINRSYTLHSTSNPSSRLNRPFDPLYPIVVPINTNMPKVEQSGRLTQEARPTKEPQRSNTTAAEKTVLPRAFSPVWEEHVQDVKKRVQSRSEEIRNHVLEQLERANRLDQNGESSSMYSPPPRHRQSVPNFASFKSSVPAIEPTAHHANGQTISVGRSPALPPKTVAYSSVPPPKTLTVPTVFHTTTPTFPPVRIPGSFPSSQKPPKKRRALSRDDSSQKCLSTLKDMGYGVGDENLKSRLHIYAEAAGGDVLEAIDMIEEDKKAHFGRNVSEQLERKRHSDDDEPWKINDPWD